LPYFEFLIIIKVTNVVKFTKGCTVIVSNSECGKYKVLDVIIIERHEKIGTLSELIL
jgi:hypothetical protein